MPVLQGGKLCGLFVSRLFLLGLSSRPLCRWALNSLECVPLTVLHLQVQQQIPAGDVAEIPQPSGSSTPEQQSTSSSSQNGGIFSRWRRPAASAAGSTPDAVAAADQAAAAAAAAITEAAPSSSEAAPDSSTHAGSSDLVYADAAMPAVVAATTTFELVEPQAPLTESLMQEPFVLVSLGWVGPSADPLRCAAGTTV